MTEPDHFRNQESAERWMKQKYKEFKWLISQASNENLSVVKKEKYMKKLLDWMSSHPILAKKIRGELIKLYPDIAAEILEEK